MRITDAHAYVVRVNKDDMDPASKPWTFVRVDTDEGVSGWGECTSYAGGSSFLTAQAVLAMKDALIGEDPFLIERLWQKMYRRHTYLGARGLPTAALSGVDIALWDIKGRALGLPVHNLLGGKVRDTVPVYANGWFGGCQTPQDYAEAARRMLVSSGHRACKLDPFREMRPYHAAYMEGQISAEGEQAGCDIVSAVREVVGPGHEILVDAHGHYNVPTAARLATRLYEESRIGWFEEPVPPESLAALRQVREQTPAPICVGERLYTRFDFAPVLEDGLADYVMPDVVWTGGITELRKIAAMAEAHYVPLSPHNAHGPLQILAGAQAGMTIPNFYRLEHSMGSIPNYNRFLAEPLDIRDGALTLPDRPGLGIDVDLDEVLSSLHPQWDA
ncbi:MAG: mandelate racemase/muconate lactonizing enzyme family protein [Chloroflexota bacterium]